jgi:hypothetical protein
MALQGGCRTGATSWGRKLKTMPTTKIPPRNEIDIEGLETGGSIDHQIEMCGALRKSLLRCRTWRFHRTSDEDVVKRQTALPSS